MKISYHWLKKYLPNLPSPEKVACLLTQAGLEVARLTPFELLPRQLIIGNVLTCCTHPNADKLKKTTIDIGKEHPLTIICGATNVSAGQKVIVAPIGATLPLSNGKVLKIQKVKIRGEVSEGMICAEEEIGLPKTQEGILVLDTKQQPGTPAHTYFNVPPDTILEIDLTPNRSDAFSHLGIARELAVLMEKDLEEPIIQPLLAADMLSLQVMVGDSMACPRYTGAILKDIQLAPSPVWLQNRLRAIGVMPINNVVDITNFVMHELGQPLHAFDYDKLASKKIMIKKMPKETPFTALDGVTRVLTGDELMLCDKKGPLAMAGIMGGERSKIVPTTQTILLEAAYFDPTTIAKATRHHSLHTEASFRFERGADPDLPRLALQRATNLLAKIAQGTIASDIIEHYPHEVKSTHIIITYAYIHTIIGISLSPTLIHNLLERLDINITETTQQGFTAIVPLYRVDVTRPADLVEEILRIYGYNNLPEQTALSIPYAMPALPYEKHLDQEHQIATFLACQGYCQIITNPLTKSTYATLDKNFNPKHVVHLENPLNQDLNSLRHTLLFSGLEVVAHNLNHGKTALKLFELGKVYQKEEEYEKIGLWLVGDMEVPNWIRKPRKATLQDVYGIVYLLLQHCGIGDWQVLPVESTLYRQCVALCINEKPFVQMGLLHPVTLDTMHIHADVFFAEIDRKVFLEHKCKDKFYTSIPKYPAIVRDLSLAVDFSVTFEQIRRVIKEQSISELQSFYLVDSYVGSHLVSSKKSYTLRFVLQDAKRTLKDQYANKVIDRIMQALHTGLGAIMRK